MLPIHAVDRRTPVELPAEARREVLELVELVRAAPRAWPDVRDSGSVEEIHEAFGRRCGRT
nr:hypothetical protein [Streptomyces pseudovenezuelae]